MHEVTEGLRWNLSKTFELTEDQVCLNRCLASKMLQLSSI